MIGYSHRRPSLPRHKVVPPQLYRTHIWSLGGGILNFSRPQHPTFEKLPARTDQNTTQAPLPRYEVFPYRSPFSSAVFYSGKPESQPFKGKQKTNRQDAGACGGDEYAPTPLASRCPALDIFADGTRASQTPTAVRGRLGGKPSCQTSLLLKRNPSRSLPVPAPRRRRRRKLEGSKLIQRVNSVADIIRSCLGPKAMLKMLLDPMGGIVLTNDGHAILREIEVSHPAAKSMIELSRTQDEEVGDGTTTVIILGEYHHEPVLAVAHC